LIPQEHRIVIPEAPSRDDYAAILMGLVEHNRNHAGRAVPGPVAVLIKDDDGTTVGGLWGSTGFDWLQIELLFIPFALRGQAIGRSLIREAERIAIARGCCGVWLDTFSFQAKAFYKALGYATFATLADHPRGEARYFMSKALPPT
jgi:GNAT superfamily N-acetyltransferase